MTKDELIAELAPQHFCNDKALTFAKQAISASEAASQVVALDKRIKAVINGFDIASYAMGAIGGALWLAYLLSGHTPKTFEEVAGSALAAFFLTMLSMLPLFVVRAGVLAYWANSDTKQLLEPIAGTNQCEDALRYLVHGGEMVAQWRDLAITERGQLHGFDCEVMRALHSRQHEMTREAKYKAKQDEACRQVHGIATAVDEVSGAAALPT
jgi:hypothetical protein